MKNLKRPILTFGMLIAFSLSIYAQDVKTTSVANKIVNGLQGAGAYCKTPDGRNGRMYPQSTTTTTTTTTSSGTSRNSGSNSRTVSSGVNASFTNPGVNAGASRTSTSGTSSQKKSVTTTTTTQSTSVCIPFEK